MRSKSGAVNCKLSAINSDNAGKAVLARLARYSPLLKAAGGWLCQVRRIRGTFHKAKADRKSASERAAA
jgi:hypothetical protein